MLCNLFLKNITIKIQKDANNIYWKFKKTRTIYKIFFKKLIYNILSISQTIHK